MMFVKQIDRKTALELAEKGKEKEVLVMLPGGKDSSWEDMMPDTLDHMLEDCMFFRKEPAQEVDLAKPAGQTIEFGPAEPEETQPDHNTDKKSKKTVDVGKLIALHNAGWPVKKIADELGVSIQTVYKYLPSKD